MRLAVIDPALGNVAGHHSAFAELLRSAPEHGFDTSLWCHQDFAAEPATQLTEQGIDIHASFSINWYEWSERDPSIRERHLYLAKLVQQLGNALLRIAAQGPATVLYHSLDWIQALALNICLDQLGERLTALQHWVLLMFVPALYQPADNLDSPRMDELNHSLGFRRLLIRKNVRAYCSCQDHQHRYRALFASTAEQPQAFDLFPSFVADWASLTAPEDSTTLPINRSEGDRAKGTKTEGNSYLVFAGDPRPDKGFVKLPQLIKQLLKQDPFAQLMVQHSPIPTWAAPEVESTARMLAEMSQDNSRLALHSQHWSEIQLHQSIRSVDQVILNYDPVCFANKSSGFLWIAAWYRKTIITHEHTWLWREASHLGCPTRSLAQMLSSEQRPWQPSSAQNVISTQRERTYAPFFTWLGNSITATHPLSPTSHSQQQIPDPKLGITP